MRVLMIATMLLPNPNPIPEHVEPAPAVYHVEKGDTLSAIGEVVHRTWQQLAGYNGLIDPNLILVGEELKVPPKTYKPKAVGGWLSDRPRVTLSTSASTTWPPTSSSDGWVQPWKCIAEGVAGGAAYGNGESGGNPADTPNGPYYGGLQFAMSTWLAYGGVGNPAYASIAEQEAVANRVLAAGGWGQWPNTSRACGYY